MKVKAKERPLLVSAPLVRPYQTGRKIHTRRLVKPAPVFGMNQGDLQHRFVNHGGLQWVHETKAPMFDWMPAEVYKCPYGKPGDRLWVRENGWQPPDDGTDIEWEYDANEPDPQLLKDAGWVRRPSIHMPRRVCRLILDVTEIRVERLHGITEDDAWDEGCPPDDVPGKFPTSVAWFHAKWVELNGQDSWDENPWVWVVITNPVTEASHADNA